MMLCFSLSSQQEKPKLIDPLDYESVISELEPELREDPLQDLLLFPDLDFTVSASLSLCASVCLCVSVAFMHLRPVMMGLFLTFWKCSKKGLFWKVLNDCVHACVCVKSSPFVPHWKQPRPFRPHPLSHTDLGFTWHKYKHALCDFSQWAHTNITPHIAVFMMKMESLKQKGSGNKSKSAIKRSNPEKPAVGQRWAQRIYTHSVNEFQMQRIMNPRYMWLRPLLVDGGTVMSRFCCGYYNLCYIFGDWRTWSL